VAAQIEPVDSASVALTGEKVQVLPSGRQEVQDTKESGGVAALRLRKSSSLAPRLALPSASAIRGIRPFRYQEATRVLIEHILVSTAAEM
jgi:hypothetical protein